MLPGMDGLDICRQLKSNRSSQHIPIIMVSAKGEESDVVLGLGGDDYVSKPFSPKELIDRVKPGQETSVARGWGCRSLKILPNNMVARFFSIAKQVAVPAFW